MPPRGRPVGTPAGRTGSAVQTVLDGLRGGEGQLLRSRNLDGFAGRGVTTFARGRFLDLELAEAVHRDFVALGGGVGDRGENGIDSLLRIRSEEPTSELQSLMRISYAVFSLKKKIRQQPPNTE